MADLALLQDIVAFALRIEPIFRLLQGEHLPWWWMRPNGFMFFLTGSISHFAIYRYREQSANEKQQEGSKHMLCGSPSMH